MNNNNNLTLKQLFTEGLIRDLILFFFLLLILYAQEWDNMLLFLFPILTFTFSIFFRILSINKWRLKYKESPLIYNPIGLEKKHANRFNFSALLQMIWLSWIGTESLIHPQLIDDYSLIFTIIFILIYSFSYYWIFIDIWKFSKIEIILNEIELDDEIIQEDSSLLNNLNNVISFLKVQYFKVIIMAKFSIFIVLNVFNIIISILTYNKIIPGISINLPGTGLEDSEPIILSPAIFVVLIVSPLITVIIIILIYKKIINFDQERLHKIIKPLSKDLQLKIINNLKAINDKFKREINIE